MMVSACTQDKVISERSVTTENGESFSIGIELDSIPILPLETELIQSNGSEDDKPVQTARALEYTVSTGNYPQLTAKDEGDSIPVYLVLSSTQYPNDRTFYSKKEVYLHVKNGYVSRPSQKVEFLGGTYRLANGRTKQWNLSSGELLFNNKNTFRLTALYAPGATRNGTTINFDGVSPNRFFKAGDKFVVGKDIKIPFVLGMVNGATRTPGVPLNLEHNSKVSQSAYWSPEYNNLDNYGFKFKRSQGAAFYPLGTLFGIRFKNNMNALNNLSAIMDPVYWQGSNGNLKMAKYNYKIRDVRMRSTTAKGTFNLENRTLAFSPNGVSNQKITLGSGKEIDLRYDGGPSPWIYFWQYSQGGTEDSSVEISLNMLNTTLGIDNLARVYRAKGSNFKNSHKYYKTVLLARELRLPPLATLAPTFISYKGDQIAWGNAWESNAKFAEGDGTGADAGNKRGIGTPYGVADLQDDNKRLLNPFTVRSLIPGEYNPKLNETKWILPSLKAIKAYFPPFISKITVPTDVGHEIVRGTLEYKEEITLNGITMIDNAVYHSPSAQNDLTGKKQGASNSIRVYYGIRHIGTDYVAAYRYIEVGKWRPNVTNPNDKSIASRYIIQSRSLPRTAGMKDGHYDGTTAKKYLEDVIAKNEFWSDDVSDGTTLTTDNIKRYRPDVIERIISLPGEMRYGGAVDRIGEVVQIFLYPVGITDYNTQNLPYFPVSNGRSASFTEGKINFGNRKTFRAMILPILLPGQGEH